MAHKITWYHDKRILLIDYIGDIHIDEIQQLNDELEFYRAEGGKPVHIISDNSKMGKTELSLPLTFKSFSTMKRYGWGWVVLIGINQAMRFFAEVFAMQFGLKLRVVTNREEALEFLKSLDNSLET